MAQLGADVEQLDALSRQCRGSADRLTASRAALDGAIRSAWWIGPDADTFRSTWTSSHSKRLSEVAQLLIGVADDLRKQAADQRAASGADGGGGPSGPLIGPVPAGPPPKVGPPPSGTPGEIAHWWEHLPPDQRAAYLDQHADDLGNLDGLPASVRDAANRRVLADDLARLEALERSGQLSGPQEAELANVRSVARYITDAEQRKDPITGQTVPVQLYIYEPGAFNGDGRVGIVKGDLDTAEHIAFNVPGITNEVDNMSPGSAANIYDEARRASGDSVAVIDWMGYDAPSGLDIGNTANRIAAYRGAGLLAADVEGLRAQRDDAHITVVAHSYGSTTAAIAADEYGLDADDLVLIGSPGAGKADNASDLTTGNAHTWVGSASHDPVSHLGETGRVDPTGLAADAIPGVQLLGNDPAENTFDANRFRAESTDRSWAWAGFPDHSKYHDAGSESLGNIGAIVGGEYDDVVSAEHRYDPLVDADVSIERGWLGVPYPSVDVDVGMQDPEADRTPTSSR